MKKTTESKEPKLVERIKIVNNDGSIATIGYMVADYFPNNPEFVGIGVSICHKTDTFDRKKGMGIAIGRITNMQPYHIKERKTWYDDTIIETQLNNFVARCLNFFKDRHIVHPKIQLV